MEIQILSLTIALLAVIVGPFLSYKIAKKNLGLKFRLTIPTKRVDKLEESAHSFLSSALEWIEKYRGAKDSFFYSKEKSVMEINRMFDAINSSIIKLQLLLDYKKPIQNDILVNVSKMKDIVNKQLFDEESISALKTYHDIIIEKVKNILQEEQSKITKIFK